LTLAGIIPGERWVDARGVIHVVTWVRKIGVVGYRLATPATTDPAATDHVMDVVRFVRTFAPLSETSNRAA
jgi:nitrous oxide reductase accessory protein NosL